jgi:hypothetical protein
LLPPSSAKHIPPIWHQHRGAKTTRLRRPPHARSSFAPKRPPHPAPNVCDDRETPLERRRDRTAIFLLLPSCQAKFGKSEIFLPSKPTLSTSKTGQSIVPRLLRNWTYPGHAETKRMTQYGGRIAGHSVRVSRLLDRCRRDGRPLQPPLWSAVSRKQ